MAMAVSFGRTVGSPVVSSLRVSLRDLSFSSRSASLDLTSAAQKMPPSLGSVPPLSRGKDRPALLSCECRDVRLRDDFRNRESGYN
jgi:hypothetical protein